MSSWFIWAGVPVARLSEMVRLARVVRGRCLGFIGKLLGDGGERSGGWGVGKSFEF
jgi:hypothetical protein